MLTFGFSFSTPSKFNVLIGVGIISIFLVDVDFLINEHVIIPFGGVDR